MMSASDASCLLDVTMELIEEIPELGALAAKLLYTVKGWPDYYLGKLVALTNIHKVCHHLPHACDWSFRRTPPPPFFRAGAA